MDLLLRRRARRATDAVGARSLAPRGTRDGRHVIAPLALVVSSTATAVVVATDGLLSNPLHIAFVVVACAGYGTMLFAEARWPALSIGLVTIATVATFFVAVVVIPRFTGDLWSYAMYGRILGVHHLSPWTHAPAAFPHDPLLHRVGSTWRHTPSVYGPAFTAVSATAAWILGATALPTRLFYQGLSAIVLGGGGWLIWRRTRSAAAVAFLTIHPLVAMYLVNGGRNDALVGVAMLAAVALVASRRPGWAGVVGALGALVKVTGIVGIAALFITMLAKGERRAAHRMGMAAAAVFSIGYLVAGRTALFTPMQTAGALYSRASAWSTLPVLGLTTPVAHVALALLALLVLIVIVRHAHSSAAAAVAAALGMLSLAAAYTLPGYAAWGLPAAALDHRSRVARIVAGVGIALIVIYEILRHPFPGEAGSVLYQAATNVGPLVLVGLVVALLRTPQGSVQPSAHPTTTAIGNNSVNSAPGARRASTSRPPSASASDCASARPMP